MGSPAREWEIKKLRAPGWMKRRAIESTWLFGWSFWVDDVKIGG
jgi:hypothetical protein